jgi:hypothetical protein
MGLTRLGNLSLMAIESDILASISNDDAIDYFASMKSRKFFVLSFDIINNINELRIIN